MTTVNQRRPGVFDPFLRDAGLQRAWRALMEGDWQRLNGFMATESTAWMFTAAILDPVVDLDIEYLERWVDVEQGAHARVALAAMMLRDASGSDNGAQPVEEAERILRAVTRERPGLADPWVYLLISGRAIGVSLEELRQRFDNAHSRSPFRPDACHHYLQGLTEKWGGFQTAVFDFARWIEVESPVDSPARSALPVAHIENGLRDDITGDLIEYLEHPDVIDELSAALLKYLSAISLKPPTSTLGVLNAYALALTPSNPRSARLVEDVFNRIDGRPTAFPWNLYREGIAEVFDAFETEQRRLVERQLEA